MNMPGIQTTTGRLVENALWKHLLMILYLAFPSYNPILRKLWVSFDTSALPCGEICMQSNARASTENAYSFHVTTTNFSMRILLPTLSFLEPCYLGVCVSWIK